ncbi:endonuclease Q family protein [Propionispora vibrioides]|uniref:TIGR00375 family protein n=1 Tax=Propionispora vibrioides TaxID=112903 RepID=A0A1H8P434_9FIRM|nr:endonuclease Q family protein [Propionispora vibrioides]SEO36612.1 TIGR00375 family protein [Propionispora vibrioides]
MKQFFADLHIHVGQTAGGKWIKIPSSRHLTVENILVEATKRKGLQMVGIIDALSPLVMADVTRLVEQGLLRQAGGGGYLYEQETLLLLGAEIETAEADGRPAHTLVYLPDLDTMRDFSRYMSRHIKNVELSTQNAHMPFQKLVQLAASFEAVIIPAHVFTPFKSLYGACSERLSYLVSDRELAKLSAIELGLSADSDMADRLAELAGFSFVTNSDAHSPQKIAREYTAFLLERADFSQFRAALARTGSNRILANYGLDPRLGKYHRNLCNACGQSGIELVGGPEPVCSHCGSKKVVRGVRERIEILADWESPRHPAYRPPYFYQIPLEFIPGLGTKSFSKLLTSFGTEMNILHQVSLLELEKVAGKAIAGQIARIRSGSVSITEGAGGIYGKLNIE